MSTFTGKPTLTTAAAVANDGFWPELLMADLMAQYRIPAEYADDVIKTGLMLAMISVNAALVDVKAAIVALPYATLAAYTTAHADTIGGKAVLLVHYETAVFARAKASLLQQFNSMNRKPEAENAAKESAETESYWLDQSQASIKALFAAILPATSVASKSGTHVALI